MNIYKFITRTILHNFFLGILWFIKNPIKNMFFSYSFAVIFWGLILLSYFYVFFFLLISSPLFGNFLLIGIILLALMMWHIFGSYRESCESRYEPKFILFIINKTVLFFKDIFIDDNKFEIRRRQKLENKIRKNKKVKRKEEFNKFQIMDLD